MTTMHSPQAWLMIGCAAAMALSAWQARAGPPQTEQVLFDFDKGFDPAKVETTDAVVRLVAAGAGSALAVATGHSERWPGLVLKAPGGTWDLSQYEYVLVDIRNTGPAPVTVACRVDNAGADGTNHCCTGTETIRPGQSATIKTVMRRPPAGPPGVKLFGMRGYPVPMDYKGVVDPAKVTQLIIFADKPQTDHAFEIDNVRASGKYVPPADVPVTAERFFPFVDRYGQYIHREWPGKTHATTDMEEARKEEEAELKTKVPKNWNAYGGWQAGPALKATGFFRVEKYEGKWWLVDPEGRLFWSHGIDCVNQHADTPLDDRQAWFADLPLADEAYKEFFGVAGTALHGYYKGRRPRTFNFAGANLYRKYGKDWRERSAETAHLRLRSWGMNTIGNWSDPRIYLMRKTPYVCTLWFHSKPIAGSSGYWGQFKDPFEPQFRENLKARVAQEAGRSAGDPWCLGYFADNEIAWGDDTSLAVATLQSPPDQAAKKAFIDDLKAKYGDVRKLNAVWGTSHESWDALAACTTPPDKRRAADDLAAFYTRIAEQYFKVCRDSIKEVAPHQLYLGCRFAWVNDRAAAAAAKYCDVVSYNLYRRTVADFKLPGGADRPVIIGEFHFGALDRGMFHTGLVPTANQAERAAAYKAYVEGALRNPLIVGTHWFQYRDQATTGRPLDEENYQIGFVDICDRPYSETVAACRQVGYGMYETRLKSR